MSLSKSRASFSLHMAITSSMQDSVESSITHHAIRDLNTLDYPSTFRNHTATTMSGLLPTGHRATSSPNSFLFAPYTGTHHDLPNNPKRTPTPYTPIHTRSCARSKYDVRNTYPVDHVLRQPHKVTKPKAPERPALWRKSRDKSGSDTASGPSRSSSTPPRLQTRSPASSPTHPLPHPHPGTSPLSTPSAPSSTTNSST
jgi:hypothetical protein